MSFPITTIPGDPRDSMHAFRTSSRQTVIGHDWRRRELFKVSRLRCSVTHVRHTCTPFTRRVCWLAREQTCSVSCRYVNSLASLGIANYNATPRRRYAVAQRGDLIPPDSPRTTDPRDSRDPNPAFPRKIPANARGTTREFPPGEILACAKCVLIPKGLCLCLARYPHPRTSLIRDTFAYDANVI